MCLLQLENNLTASTFTLPLFPLSAHILPGGRMALRIFEPRYIRMVKEACEQSSGFAICMLNAFGDKSQNQHIHPVGTFVTVEDFDRLEDGLLGITVQGHRCVEVLDIRTEDDDLRIGSCEWLDNWTGDSVNTTQQDIDPMVERLRELFDKYPEVKTLYEKPDFDNPAWVIYRWLELIPVKAEQKQRFLQHKDYSIALDYLSQLVK